ncbi:RICIN domain-containing protein [Kitasatospora sp. NPDC093806]|uniref:RICIN domain-containing protein n=1 Tax=Kitasatospora sp. NPDC093806 TaxID=3155075 RepID=UPI00342CFCC2
MRFLRFTRSTGRFAARTGVIAGAAALSATTLLAAPAEALPTQHRWANVATGKCLDIRGADVHYDALLQQFSCKVAGNQKIQTDTYLGDPTTDMRVMHSGMCLEPTGMEAGATIVQRTCNYSQGQRWEFTWYDAGATIKNKVTGLCIDDAGMPSGSRREVRQQPCTAAAGQLWRNLAANG